jgi:hypothetical protein
MKKKAYFCNSRRTGTAWTGSDPAADDLRETSDLQFSGNAGI